MLSLPIPALNHAARMALLGACLLLAGGGAGAQERSAMELADSARLYDMGSIADAGGRGARWWVEAVPQGGNPASPCAPRTLHVLVDVHMQLAREGVAREWMQLAHQRWVQDCAAERRATAPMMVRIQIHQGFELAPDASGHMPRGLVNAMAAFQNGSLSFQQYQNSAAQAPAQSPDEGNGYEANAQRLSRLAQRYQAGRVMDMQGLDRLRSKPVEKVLLMAIQPGALVGRNKRVVHGARHEGWDASSAVVEGAEVAKWNDDSRMVAVRVKARSTDVRTPDRWVLTLLGSQPCRQRDCEDFLLMPGGQWITQRELH
ncbi:hypothetical protein GCM10027082_37550 [Comamonas humi]